MKNELLRIGPFTVYGYGLMIAIGILSAYFTGEYRPKKRKLPYEYVFYLVVWCVVGGFLGAKILYWITEWKSILENPGFLSATLTDGFVVFGGIVGGIFTAYVYCRVKKLDFLKFLILTPSVALAQGFGKNWVPAGRMLLRKRNVRCFFHYVSYVCFCTKWGGAGSYADLFQYS